jgi:hypothetical protein
VLFTVVWLLVKSEALDGIVLIFSGVITSLLPTFFSGSLGASTCPLFAITTFVSCVEPTGIAVFVYYLATAGGALLMMGVWRVGIGRNRIVRDGGWLVSSIGATVLALGFFASSLYGFPTSTSAQIGYFFGLLGSALMIGGIVKMNLGAVGSTLDLLDVRAGTRIKIRAPAARLLIIAICSGCIATVVSGWLVTVNIVTPGGGGVYWGFPLSWKSISAWLGTYYGFQYNWPVFVLDSFFYTAAVFFFLYIGWLNLSPSGTRLVRFL